MKLPAYFTDLRRFIFKLDLFLLVSGFVFLHKRGSAYGHWAIGCLIFLIVALAFPGALRPIRRALHKISGWWGRIVTFVILFVVYFAALVPLGLLAGLFGKEFLALKPDPEKETYWIPRQKNASNKTAAERQY